MKPRLPFLPTMRHLLVCLALGALSVSAFGELTISASGEKPAADVRLQFEANDDTGNTTLYHRGTGGYRHIGQAFTVQVPQFTMTAVSFRIWEAAPSTRGKQCSIKLFRVKAPHIAPDPVNDLVFSQSGHLPQQLDPQQYLTFQLDAPQLLEEGVSYLLMLGFDEPTSTDNKVSALGLERTNGNPNFGRMWTYNGEQFAADRKALLFYLHGTEAP